MASKCLALLLALVALSVGLSVAKQPDRTLEFDQMLNEFELEVTKLPEKESQSSLKPSQNRSVNDLLAQYEAEAISLGGKPANEKDLTKDGPLNDLLGGVLGPILGGNGQGGVIGGGTGNILTPVGDLVKALLKIVAKLLTQLADLLRTLAKQLVGSLLKGSAKMADTLEEIYGPNHFLVRFLREFLDPQTSPFIPALNVANRLDKIMDIYYGNEQQS